MRFFDETRLDALVGLLYGLVLLPCGLTFWEMGRFLYAPIYYPLLATKSVWITRIIDVPHQRMGNILHEIVG